MEFKMVDETAVPAAAASAVPAATAPAPSTQIIAAPATSIAGSPPVSSNAELLALLNLVCDVVNAAIAVEKSGAVSLADLPIVMGLIPDLGPAFANVKAVPGEIMALSQPEILSLVESITARLVISNAKAQLVVSASLQAASALLNLYQAIKA
jgi:hypothetical protein